MKISEIRIHQLGEQESGGAAWAGNMILLELVTDNGLVGYGEAVPTLRVQPVIQSLREVARLYKGRDPLDAEKNQADWRKQDFYLPISFDSMTALSAFDIACWDIAGKHYGAPVHELIGGRTRETVRVYSNGWYSDCITPEEFGEKAEQFAKMGYTGLKFDVFGAYFDYIDEKGLTEAHQRTKSVSDATNGRVELMIEHHGRFNPNSAIMIARKLREFDPLFMEEPIHPDNVRGMRKYRRTTDVRVALGERLLTLDEALLVLSQDLTDFLQPDVTNIGGVTGARKVAALAEAFGVEIAFHNAFGPVQNAATIQLDAAIPNFLIQESFYDVFPQWKRDVIGDEMKIEGGYAKVPTRPGLGIRVDEKVIESHTVEGQESFNPDVPVWAVKNTWSNYT